MQECAQAKLCYFGYSNAIDKAFEHLCCGQTQALASGMCIMGYGVGGLVARYNTYRDETC